MYNNMNKNDTGGEKQKQPSEITLTQSSFYGIKSKQNSDRKGFGGVMQELTAFFFVLSENWFLQVTSPRPVRKQLQHPKLTKS